MVRILGICGSPRRGATEYVLEKALEVARTLDGVETEMVLLRQKKLHFCLHCDRCITEGVLYCPVHDDDVKEILDKFLQADGYILASPVYLMGMTGQMATLFNRFRPLYTVLKANPEFFFNKVGGAIAVGGTRNGGQEATINCLLGVYHTYGINVVNGGIGIYSGASVWSKDRKAEGAREDEIGMKNACTVALRVAKMALRMACSRS
ncbi:flavodoxin family protein [Moorellaceae bacterium AZ2]